MEHHRICGLKYNNADCEFYRFGEGLARFSSSRQFKIGALRCRDRRQPRQAFTDGDACQTDTPKQKAWAPLKNSNTVDVNKSTLW